MGMFRIQVQELVAKHDPAHGKVGTVKRDRKAHDHGDEEPRAALDAVLAQAPDTTGAPMY